MVGTAHAVYLFLPATIWSTVIPCVLASHCFPRASRGGVTTSRRGW